MRARRAGLIKLIGFSLTFPMAIGAHNRGKQCRSKWYRNAPGSPWVTKARMRRKRHNKSVCVLAAGPYGPGPYGPGLICLALSERDICVNPPPEGPTGLAVEEVVNRSEKREPSTNDASQQPDHLLRYQPMRLVPLSRCAYMGKMRSRSQLYICTRTIRQNVFARLS